MTHQPLPDLPTDSGYRDALQEFVYRALQTRPSPEGEGRAIAAAIRVLRADPAARRALLGELCDTCTSCGLAATPPPATPVQIFTHPSGALIFDVD